MTAKAPAHAVGRVDVTVTTPGGTSPTSGTGNDYSYVAPPTVTSLSPTSGPTAGGTTVIITGTNLSGATAVKFGATAATSVSVVSSTKITAKAPAHAVGKVDVTVTTPGGTSPTSGTGNDYTYTTRYEQTDARLSFAGTWTTTSAAAASGHSYKQTKTSGSSVTIPFTGTRLYWVATKGPSLGDASVSVDGKTAVTVHLYSASPAYQVKVWNTGALSSGYHTVKITWKATTGKYIDLDAVEVAGSLTAATRFQETDSHLLYAPAWTSTSDTHASGRTYRYTNTANAQVTIKFTGVSIGLLAKKAPSFGKAYVSLDGGAAVLVDFYACDPHLSGHGLVLGLSYPRQPHRGHQAGLSQEQPLHRLHHQSGCSGCEGGAEVGPG